MNPPSYQDSVYFFKFYFFFIWKSKPKTRESWKKSPKI